MSLVNVWQLEYYGRSISKFIDRGYKVGPFVDFLEDSPHRCMVLRHDIDFDPDLVRAMVRIELENSVRSTIFFRTCSSRYNLLSFRNVRLLKWLNQEGFEVGLHLDAEMYRSFNLDKFESANLQKRVIEDILGTNIMGFSLHYPGTNQEYIFADELALEWKLPYHAYDDKFFKSFKYLSDSGGRWREGHFSEFLEKENRLQVLTHPIWHYVDSIQENF